MQIPATQGPETCPGRPSYCRSRIKKRLAATGYGKPPEPEEEKFDKFCQILTDNKHFLLKISALNLCFFMISDYCIYLIDITPIYMKSLL